MMKRILLILLAALLLITAPAVADDTQSSTLALTMCEVSIIADNEVKRLGLTIDGESDKTSALVVHGGTVTISVASIPSGKNLVVSHTGNAVLTKSGMTIIVSNVQSERVTVTMKLESAGGGGGGNVRPSTPSIPDVPDTPGDEPGEPDDESHTSIVGNDGDAHFKDHEVIIRVTVPDKYAGEKIEVIDGASVEAADDMDIYHQADIRLHFELEDGDKALVHFKIPASEFKAKGLTENDACLYHYSEKDGWTRLPTWHVTSGEYLIYESETDDFSPFAIVFEKDAAKPKDVEPIQPQTNGLLVSFCIAALLVVLIVGIGIAVAHRRRK